MKKTPLFDAHIANGAQFTEFSGWLLPLQYSGIVAEHLAVRNSCGLFDVSHMGQIRLSGTNAATFFSYLVTNKTERLTRGLPLYSPMCYDNGCTVDDLIAFPIENDILLCVNAVNINKDFDWISAHAPSGVLVENLSDQYALLALQGPDSALIWHAIRSAYPSVLAVESGYTGEHGYELYCDPKLVRPLWDDLIRAGAVPCGLGCRDTLRLEAGLCLYGHELSEQITPLEAGLKRFVALDKDDFIGKSALSSSSPSRRLIGLVMAGRAIPRAGYELLRGGKTCGYLTSGGLAPALGQRVAMAFCDSAAIEGEFSILVRGKPEPCREVRLPFYKRRQGV